MILLSEGREGAAQYVSEINVFLFVCLFVSSFILWWKKTGDPLCWLSSFGSGLAGEGRQPGTRGGSGTCESGLQWQREKPR